jgi:uncharacterized UBP type Zn finger protein
LTQIKAPARRGLQAPSVSTCPHVLAIDPVAPRTPQGCEECLRMGSPWVHLRLCLHCGHVGCCDSSPQRHATRHFLATRHPVLASFEPGERWAWCYVDEAALPVPAPVTAYLR